MVSHFCTETVTGLTGARSFSHLTAAPQVWLMAGPGMMPGAEVLSNTCALKNLMNGPSGWKCSQAVCRGTSEVTRRGIAQSACPRSRNGRHPLSHHWGRPPLPHSPCHPGSKCTCLELPQRPVLLASYHLPLLLLNGLSGVCPTGVCPQVPLGWTLLFLTRSSVPCRPLA